MGLSPKELEVAESPATHMSELQTMESKKD
jgi:hypothetical protein